MKIGARRSPSVANASGPAEALPAGLVGQGAGQEGLSRAGGAGDDDIVVTPYQSQAMRLIITD